MNIDNELKSHFFKGQGKKLNRCLSPTMDCEEKAIRAHSVQNAKALDLLSCDGHVIHLHPRLRADKPPEVCFEKIGRNQATTFTGLFAQHDQDLFRELDTQDFDGTNQSQLFLLAYRSVLRELHAVIDGGIKIQAAYQKRVELGLDPKDEPSPAGIEAAYHMMQAWRTFRYRCEFDRIRETSSYEGLVHHVRNLNLEMPTIGASTFYGIGKYTYIWGQSKLCVPLSCVCFTFGRPIFAGRTRRPRFFSISSLNRSFPSAIPRLTASRISRIRTTSA
jgi:hypothetical protein